MLSCAGHEALRKTPRNAFYAQSGGVSAVINASACGVHRNRAQAPESRSRKVYAGRDGIVGALTEDLIDTSKRERGDDRGTAPYAGRRLRLGALQTGRDSTRTARSTSA